MWFDVAAALAEIESAAQVELDVVPVANPANSANSVRSIYANSQDSQNSQDRVASGHDIGTGQNDNRFAEFARFAAPQESSPTNPTELAKPHPREISSDSYERSEAETSQTRKHSATAAGFETAPTTLGHPRPTAETASVDENRAGEFRRDEFRHGRSVTGAPRTWTGRVVSVDEWRRLTEWERHGPDGRHWNALTEAWEFPEDHPDKDSRK